MALVQLAQSQKPRPTSIPDLQAAASVQIRQTLRVALLNLAASHRATSLLVTDNKDLTPALVLQSLGDDVVELAPLLAEIEKMVNSRLPGTVIPFTSG